MVVVHVLALGLPFPYTGNSLRREASPARAMYAVHVDPFRVHTLKACNASC